MVHTSRVRLFRRREGAAVLTVGIDAEAFEAETLVVGDGAFEIRGRNADMLDAGDGVTNGHGKPFLKRDGFAGIGQQSHRENRWFWITARFQPGSRASLGRVLRPGTGTGQT